MEDNSGYSTDEIDNTDSDPDFYPSGEEKQQNILEEDVSTTGATSRTTPMSPEKSAKSRWRKRNLTIREKAKCRRNLGQSYKSIKTGKVVEPRVMGTACTCPNKCRTNFQGTETGIFHSFWDLASWNAQNAYLFSCMKIGEVKRKYHKKTKRQESRRKFTVQYSVKVNGVNFTVCKVEFLSVHGLQNNRGRVENISKQISQGTSLPTTDKRGKHYNRPNKTSTESLESIHRHIAAIPKYQSHYSRNQNPHKVYLNYDMSVSSLYHDYYKEYCREQGIHPASEDKYRRVFCTQYNIGFKMPQSDTCKICDEYSTQIDALSSAINEDQRNKLITERNLHQLRAQAMQDRLVQDANLVKDDSKLLVISFDLMQALPTPKITSGPAFYKRKLWAYCENVHDCGQNKGYMFVWTENIGNRGSDEIGSVLLKFLETQVDKDKLIVYSDNCPGQNKNWVIMALWLHLVATGRFKSIEHNFLITGHTRLPSDRDFSCVEKRQRHYSQQVCSPDEWKKIMVDARRSNKLMVCDMTQDNIIDLHPLLRQIIKKNKTDDGQPLKFCEVVSFKFVTEEPRAMFVKHRLNAAYSKVSVTKRGRPMTLALQKKYNRPLPIDAKKLQDIKSLLPYIGTIHHPFYLSLTPQRAASEGRDNEAPEMIQD